MGNYRLYGASLVAQRVKRLPAMQETQVRSLGGQPSSVFLPGESHGQRSLVGYSPRGLKELDTTEGLHFHFTPWKKSYDQPRQHIKKQTLLCQQRST